MTTIQLLAIVLSCLFSTGFCTVCPDKATQCDESQSTCCELVTGKFGCCPIEDAVCCSDRQHCCPNGFHCVHGGLCTRGIHSSTSVMNRTSTSCPGGKYYCPDDDSTCCPTSSTSFACCPLPEAVCCQDGIHCCPKDTHCHPESGECLRDVPPVLDTPCSANFSCPNDFTCCNVPSGAWGCCPLPNAVCCPDKVHCCSQGSTCGPSGCHQISSAVQTKFHDVVCLSGTHQCPDKTNGFQCCPKGTHCNPESGTCLRGVPPVSDTPCSANFSCPGDDTCCNVAGGRWGCCPLPNAVCCPDKLHCCPQGTTCGPSGCQQMNNGVSVPKTKFRDIVCPGGTHQCPDQTTCCQLSNGTWGCCPLPNAVCCSDKLHCCPSGYTCSAAGFCILPVLVPGQKPIVIPWVLKQRAARFHEGIPTGNQFLNI